LFFNVLDVCNVLFQGLFLVVITSAVNCLERLVSEMTCYVLSGTLNPTHSLTGLLIMYVFGVLVGSF